MNHSTPGHEIRQARELEWVAIPFSRGSLQPRYWTQVFCIAGRFSTSWAWEDTGYWYPAFLLNHEYIFMWFSSGQFSSVTQLCLTLCDPLNCSTPGLPVHHQLPEFTQTHVHRVGDAIQPSHPLSSPSPPAINPSQHQSLFQWVNSSHEVAKVLEFQLQHQSFQRTTRTDIL